MDLKALQSDPGEFRRAWRIQTDFGSSRWGLCADGWQREVCTALDPSWRRVVEPGQLDFDRARMRAWLEWPRGHDKTGLVALYSTWCLFASARKLTGVVAAADRDQARLVRDRMEEGVRLNPWMQGILEIQEHKVLNRHTGSTLTIIPSDVPGSYGLLCDFIVAEEVSHWQGRGMFDSLLSTAGKKAACFLMCVGNAGFQDSWQFELREAVRTDPGWLFSRLDGPQASWISEDRLAEQRRLLPDVAYRRLWLNEWSSGAGDAFEPELIDRAVTLERPPGREPGFGYVAGVDLGLSRDATGVVVIGKGLGWVERTPRKTRRNRIIDALADTELWPFEPEEKDYVETYHEGTGRLKLASVKVWKPRPGRKVQLEEIESALLELHRAFGLACVAFDPYQAEYLGQRLVKAGVPAVPIHQSGTTLQAMATATLDAFREGLIDLFPHDDLVADLKALRVVEKSYGYRLTSPHRKEGESGTRHGDCATALQLALHVARGLKTPTVASRGSLVLHPA